MIQSRSNLRGVDPRETESSRSIGEPRVVAFERLLAELSAGFVGVAAADLDEAICHRLGRIASLLALDVGAVMEVAAASREVRLTHRYVRAGVGMGGHDLRADQFPWLVSRLLAGEVIRFATLDDLPATAPEDRRSMAKRGVRSAVICPIVADRAVTGAVAFACIGRERRWRSELMDRLCLVGQLFAGALARRRLEERLAEARAFAEDVLGRRYVVGLEMDVSALEAAEDQIRRQQAELAHAARVSAMGALAAAIAHELNQPLTAIRTNAQATRRMLARNAVDATELAEALSDITDDAVRASEIIRRLRDLLRKGHAERVPLDVNELIRAVEPFARADVLEHNARLVMDLAPALPRVLGDRVQLQQVLLNLVRNSSEAMRGGDPERRDLVVVTAVAGHQVEVTVCDNGPLLSDDAFARMFTPFYTSKPEGLGIGLSLSRSIVEAHGGLLWATRNAAESGITMHFTLPCEESVT